MRRGDSVARCSLMQTPTIARVAALVAIGLALLATPSWAVEEGAGSPFAGDIGNALWTLVVFIAVVLVLGKYAWGPILRSMQDREDFIRDSLAQAKSDRQAAEARLLEYNDKLAEAHGEVAEIIEEARRDANVLKQRIEEEARGEADKIIQRARREVGIARDGAIKEIYSVTARLATEVASRIVGRELKAQDQERLIQESLDELSQLPEN